MTAIMHDSQAVDVAQASAKFTLGTQGQLTKVVHLPI